MELKAILTMMGAAAAAASAPGLGGGMTHSRVEARNPRDGRAIMARAEAKRLRKQDKAVRDRYRRVFGAYQLLF